MNNHAVARLILGSTSPFRKELLQRLTNRFETVSPQVDETRLQGESPEQLVARLAEAKARAAASKQEHALVIGSDQVAVLGEDILGKPGSHDKAMQQLRNCSGKSVTFLTGLCLYNTDTGTAHVEVVPFTVVFRNLTDARIDAYLKKEQPYNCAGSFKSEGLGSVLFEKLIGDDPTTLIGLPLIRLVRMLEDENYSLLDD
jgi:MAF protein